MAASAYAEVTSVWDGRVSPEPPHCLCAPLKPWASLLDLSLLPPTHPLSALYCQREGRSLSWVLGCVPPCKGYLPFMFLSEWIHLGSFGQESPLPTSRHPSLHPSRMAATSGCCLGGEDGIPGTQS